MLLSVLVLVAGTAFAGPPQKNAEEPPEEKLRGMLLKLRHGQDWEVRQAIFSGGDELRDAVTAGTGAVRTRAADRLPGMAKDPLDVCPSLVDCPEAPQSLHVEDADAIDDAFLALARPWLKLQQARGKTVSLLVDHGVGVQLTLQDFPQQTVVTLTASPAATGGFDVASDAGPAAEKAYGALRTALMNSAGN